MSVYRQSVLTSMDFGRYLDGFTFKIWSFKCRTTVFTKIIVTLEFFVKALNPTKHNAKSLIKIKRRI